MPGLDQRASRMAIDRGTTMAGYMLDDWEYGLLQQALTYGASEASDTIGVTSVSPVANHRIGSANWKIEDR
jgi:hypothetical protein